MPNAEICISGFVKETQKDEKPAAEFSLVLKDAQIGDYDGAKRVTVPADGAHLVDLASNQQLKFLAVLVLSGTSVTMNFKKPASDSNGVEVARFFYAEVKNIDFIKLTNKNKEDVVVRIFMVCGSC
jgi:hypothetical protein